MKKHILVFSTLIIFTTFFTACEQDPITNPANDITQINADYETTKLSQEEVEQFLELLENETTEDGIESRCNFPVAINLMGPYSAGVFPIPCISRYRFILSTPSHNTPQDYYITIQQNRTGTYPIFDVIPFYNVTYADFMSQYYYRDTGNSSINECEITARIYVKNRTCNTFKKILDVPLAL